MLAFLHERWLKSMQILPIFGNCDTLFPSNYCLFYWGNNSWILSIPYIVLEFFLMFEMYWKKVIFSVRLSFFFYIHNLHFSKQKVYSHQVLIYLNVPEIPVRKPLQNRQIVSWRTTGCVSLGVICASLLTGRHLLMNKKDKKSRYTNI